MAAIARSGKIKEKVTQRKRTGVNTARSLRERGGVEDVGFYWHVDSLSWRCCAAQIADRALVEELRERSKHKIKEKVTAKENETDVNTTKIVRDAPVVVEHKRYVDDPPRVIERKIIVDEPARAKCKRGLIENCDADSRASGDSGKKRVIDADAEVTILGPDRMSIRLFRKGHGPNAKASDGE